MTLEQYIRNPMGKGNATISLNARITMQNTYKKKFHTVMLKEKGQFKTKMFYIKQSNTYVLYIKVPSETVKDFYYDVVFQFQPNNDTKEAGNNLMKYDIKFFSNDPAFVYTYANTFIQHDLFIKQLGSKMSKTAIKQKAEEKNPSNTVGYVKTFYFAYLYMVEKNLVNLTRFSSLCSTNIGYKDIITEIEDADSKIADREAEGKKQVHQRQAKRKADNDINIAKSIGLIKHNKTNVKMVHKIESIQQKKSKGNKTGIGHFKKG